MSIKSSFARKMTAVVLALVMALPVQAIETPQPGQLGMSTPTSDFIGTDASRAAELNDYVSMGVKWLRLDIWWSWAEPNQGMAYYNFAAFDKYIDQVAAKKIKIIGIINSRPGWVSPGITTAAEQQAYAKFAKAAAARYKGKIDVWELYNEPNQKRYQVVKPAVWPDHYTALLKAAYPAIKSVNPNATVLVGGLSPVPTTQGGYISAVEYLTRIYQLGGKNYFDAVAFHPYTYPDFPSTKTPWNGWQIMENGIRSTMVTYGDSAKKIWVTEIGAPTAGSGSAVTEAEQAEIMRQAVVIARKLDYLGPVLWYSYMDKGYDANSGVADTPENHFGVVMANGKQKASYNMYKGLVRSEPTFRTQDFVGTGGNDVIYGNEMNNTILGGNGNDEIHGGNGNDRLQGGAGNDHLYGEGGADIYDLHTGFAIGTDYIHGFEQGGDKIDVSGIDGNANASGFQGVKFVGTAAFKNAGDLRYYKDTAKGITIIQIDTNGDGKVDITAQILSLVDLKASDFVF
ncbi:cellulase family glycosylhydrolase [Bdellovibrio sp. HCB209]|uniref:cellulase family glycosylhydrolase n=1 Tax=Bdellovibrio sp. HCB209 TaxID=3394354 RepID=UPI0039B6576F